MNRVNRFLYWNMNYHIEHHMFPLVPYHALPRLHEEMKADCPAAYKSIAEAFREIIPALRKQVKNPEYFVARTLPEGAGSGIVPGHLFRASTREADKNGLVRICMPGEIDSGEVIRFDLDEQTFAVYKLGDDRYYMTDGVCTHGNSHLSDGLIIGDQIECSKHNGRFRIEDGSPQRLPVCDPLRSWKLIVKEGYLCFDVGLAEEGDDAGSFDFRVVSNHNVATFIKELVLEPLDGSPVLSYQPGDYLKLEIPSHRTGFGSMEIDEPFKKDWKEINAFRNHSFNAIRTRRNYSLASNPEKDKVLKFNIRIALPPMGINCYAGIGSSYVFNLKPGDLVKASGPFGNFHINDSDREMVFVGGGAGMAPLRSQISWLLDSHESKRKLSFWYGARSAKELFYEDYFRKLDEACENFSYHVALSESGENMQQEYQGGFIHEVLDKEYLSKRENIRENEYYLCGPPAMIEALRELLQKYMVPESQIRFDEF
jgi:Na(+)-translocating NADH:ubiquinone oxidoreductase F subunit